MTLEQLRIFIAVAERGHMTQAAQALNVTQSAASAAVAALEARHGVLLFDRVGRRLELSEAGRLFLPEAKAVLAQSASAGRVLDDLAGLERGQVRIAASQTVASYWLPPYLAAFAAARPAIDLSLSVGNTQRVAAAVVDGSADLGFVEGMVDSPVLQRLVVGHDRLSLYAAPDHPLAAKAVGVADLKAEQWIIREPGSGTRSAFEAALAKQGVDFASLAVLLELPSNEAVLAAVASSLALTAVSDLAAAPQVAAGALARLAFDVVERPFQLLRHRERVASRASTAFMALVQ